MRFVLLASLALTACSSQPTADADALEDFLPPTVQLRGDVIPLQRSRFARLDRNADNVVTPDEYPRRNPARLKALDANRDGTISRAEMEGGALARFDALDADHDGRVTSEERSAGRPTQ